MFRRTATVALLVYVLLLPSFVFAQGQSAPNAAAATQATVFAAQPDVIARIREEGLNHSQVIPTLAYMTDVIGARLTGSPNLKRANEWTRDQMAKWGLQNAHLEAWGPFGRGWSLKSFTAEVTAPQAIPLIAYPKAWSPGVNLTNAEVVYVDAADMDGLQKYKGQLKGKIVLTSALRDIKAHFDALGVRYTDKELEELATAAEAQDSRMRRYGDPNNPQFQAMIKSAVFSAQKAEFIQNEGAALLVDTSRSGDGGTVFVQSATVPQKVDANNPMSLFLPRISPYAKDAPAIVPQITLASEHYNRLIRILKAGEPVRMSVHLDVQFHDEDLNAYNTIAEIPGSDPKLKDEVVMLGGHLDSWHSGTGATDNGAGCAVVMEAARIIQALGLKPRRTIRVALWSGEEQGLYGSRAYVAQHFGKVQTTDGEAGAMRAMLGAGGTPTVIPGAEYGKLAGYFNLDNGTGKIRGIYLQGNSALRPLFTKWLEPFRDLGATTVTIRNTSGTDHQSFDGIGLPGFQFIQDEIEYDSRTHHSNMDVFDRIQEDDMKQAAVVMAAFVYQTAMMDDKLARKTVNLKTP